MKNTENMCLAGGLCAILAISTATWAATSPAPAVPPANAEWTFTVKQFPAYTTFGHPMYLKCVFRNKTYDNRTGAFTVKGRGQVSDARCAVIITIPDAQEHNPFEVVYTSSWEIDQGQAFTCTTTDPTHCGRLCSKPHDFCLDIVSSPASTLTITYGGPK